MTSKKRWILRWCILGVVFLTMGWLTIGIPNVFTSPDESANAFFASVFSRTGSFSAQEPLEIIANNLIHPRSVIVSGTQILPTGFLGFPFIAGVIRFLLGPFFEFSLTPIIAITAICAFWWIIERLTKNETLADLTAFFTLIHPAFWYYSARTMMPNVALVSLLLISVAVFIKAQSHRPIVLGTLAGLLFGLALSCRLVEAPIIFVTCAIVAISYRKSLALRPLLAAIIGTLLILTSYLLINTHVYGSPLTTGYTFQESPQTSLAQGVTADLSAEALAKADRLQPSLSYLLPFGFHERSMVKNAFWYGWWLFPFSSTLAVVGAWFAWTSKEHRKAWRTFIIALSVATFWLLAVYGSWQIADNPDPRAITIGNSHVRYWLPLFVASSVLGAYAVTKIQRDRIVMIIVIILSSINAVFAGTDGLIATRSALQTFEEKRTIILDKTPSDAVIIVDRADKYLFPSRAVIVPLRSDTTYAALPTLVASVPLYYFGITFPPTDLDYLRTQKLAPFGLGIDAIVTINEETLYVIAPVASNDHSSLDTHDQLPKIQIN